MTSEAETRMTIYLRTSKALHTWLKAQAKKNNRSLNQEVEYRLRQQQEAEKGGSKNER